MPAERRGSQPRSSGIYLATQRRALTVRLAALIVLAAGAGVLMWVVGPARPVRRAVLPALAGSRAAGSGHLQVLLSDLLFPYPAVSAELLARRLPWRGAVRSGLAWVLADRRDIVERALRSRALRG